MYPVDREMLTVTEDALECGAILGSGAFGTVFEVTTRIIGESRLQRFLNTF